MTLNNFTKFYEDTIITYQVRARTSQKMPFFDIWPLSVTLTFHIGPWVLYATRLLMTLNILTKFYEATTITYQVLARTSHKMPIFDLWPLSVTLTFDIGPRVLYATRLLMTLNNLTKFYEDTTITYQVMARTRSDGRTHGRTDGRTHAQTLKKIVATMSRETASGLDKNCGDYVLWNGNLVKYVRYNIVCQELYSNWPLDNV